MKTSKNALALSDDLLAELGIGTAEVVESIENALRQQRANALWATPKSALMPGDGRYMMTTLSAADEPKNVAVKFALVAPDNPARGLSGINGAIMLLDSDTGLLRAIMGANWVTAVRTAGLSAVAAKRLADPKSSSVAFVGCGVQARSHLDAFAEMFPLTEIRAFGRGQANIDRLSEAAEAKGLAARACDSPQDALEGADLVVSSITLSYEVEPFLDARWLKPGAFAAITDLGIPWVSDGMSAFETVVIDDREQEASSEKPLVAPDLVSGDLGELVGGDVEPAPGKRAAFVFRGLALGDFAVASLGYARAEAEGKGTVISM